jgi:hypothetical protein
MSKYLRYLESRFGVGNSQRTWRENSACDPRLWQAPMWNIQGQYRRLILPIAESRMSKLNVCLSLDGGSGPPYEDGLQIGYVWEPFDQAGFLEGELPSQKRYYLDVLHSALLRTAEAEGWDSAPLHAAHEQVVRSNYEATFVWKKPVSSPDRQHKAQIAVQMTAAHSDFYLLISDRRANELQRVLLARSAGEYPQQSFKMPTWIDDQTVHVGRCGAREYWECKLDGTSTFRSPKAETGDAQAIYALGKLYFEGGLLLQDETRGLGLIRQAAALGYKHALQFEQWLRTQGRL